MTDDKIDTSDSPPLTKEFFAGASWRIPPTVPEGTKMNVVTLSHAKQHLEKLVEKVLADAEPIIVSTDTGESVVLLPLDEFNAWQETFYLLRHPANANHLMKSIAEAQAGKILSKT